MKNDNSRIVEKVRKENNAGKKVIINDGRFKGREGIISGYHDYDDSYVIMVKLCVTCEAEKVKSENVTFLPEELQST